MSLNEKHVGISSQIELWVAKYFSITLSAIARIRGHSSLSILIYHRVLKERDPLRPSEPDVVRFERDMQLISTCLKPMSLADALLGLQNGNLPRGAVCVTFDDGYADNEQLALPILQKWNIPATMFVASGYLNGGRMWNDTIIESIRLLAGKELDLKSIGLGVYRLDSVQAQLNAIAEIIGHVKFLPQDQRQDATNTLQSLVKGLPNNLMLNDAQLINLHQQGIEIGGHTCLHPILSSLPPEDAFREIADGKNDLESLLGKKLRFFAYPNGKLGRDFTDQHAQMVKDAGFSWALTTDWGVSTHKTNPFQLPRFTPWDSSPWRFIGRIWQNALGWL